MAALRVKTNPETSSTGVFMSRCTGTGSAGVLARQVVSPICFEDARDRAVVPLHFPGFSLGRATWDGIRSQTDSISVFLCSRHYDRVRRLREHRQTCKADKYARPPRRHTRLLLRGRLNQRRTQVAPFDGTTPSHHSLLCFMVSNSLSQNC